MRPYRVHPCDLPWELERAHSEGWWVGHSHIGFDFSLVLVFCCGQKEDRFVVFVGVSKVVIL